MGSATLDRPKCLLEVGGQSLLHRSLCRLAQAGVLETFMIVGHAAATIADVLDRWAGPMRVTTIATPDYATRGSMGSLLTAVERCGTSPMLLLESDLLYHADFLAIAASCQASTILTADASGSGDEVYVCTDALGGLAYLGKAAPPAARVQSRGEFAGISLLLETTLSRYAATARHWLSDGRTDAHYEEVLLALAATGHAIAVRHCPGLPWTEVDTAADLARALQHVWPRLAARQDQLAVA